MATRRRGRGATSGGTLGTLVRGAMAQAGVVREVLERGARDSKARLDDVLRERRRRDALADLGERALAQLRAGTPEGLLDDDEVAALVELLDGFDDAPGPAAADTSGTAAAVASVARDMMSSLRARFDDREPGARRDRGAGPDDDDGTVGSGAVWRGGGAGGIRFDEPDEDEVDATSSAPRPFADAPDDDDLADYMHPDDVPAAAGPARGRDTPDD